MPDSTEESRNSNTDPPASQTLARSSRVMSRTIGGILWLLVGVAFLVIFATSPSAKEEQKKNSQQPAIQIEIVPDKEVEFVTRKVEDFSFTERSEKTVTRADLLGKPWVVNFIFTSCAMSCPANTKTMMELSHACKDADVRFVTITVDPERDTPERLRDYAEIYQADPEQWLFLTGAKSEIHDLIRSNFLLAVEERKKEESPLFGYEFAHSDKAMYIDADGTIVGSFLLTDPTEMALLKRVLLGKKEVPKKNLFLVPKKIPNSKTTEVKNEPEEKKTVQEKEEAPKTVSIPKWIARLPALNAFLNGIATLLLIFGYCLIRNGKQETHKKVMLSAFVVSVLFLGSYLTYHWSLHHYTGESSRKFPDLGFLRQIYLSILFSHILLAALVPFLSLATIYLGIKKRWEKHRFWAQITFPIWLYVSVTGVIIYWMLYHLAA